MPPNSDWPIICIKPIFSLSLFSRLTIEISSIICISDCVKPIVEKMHTLRIIIKHCTVDTLVVNTICYQMHEVLCYLWTVLANFDGCSTVRNMLHWKLLLKDWNEWCHMHSPLLDQLTLWCHSHYVIGIGIMQVDCCMDNW
jgi:hypothetical protein